MSKFFKAVGVVAVSAAVLFVHCLRIPGTPPPGSEGNQFNPDISYGTLADLRDGKVYRTVKIGSQTWMAENLNYNGTVLDPMCYDGKSNCTEYGQLYDWSMAMGGSSSSSTNPSGVRGLCPSGWHLPSDAEWTQLTDAVGGEATAGKKLKSTLSRIGLSSKSTYGWSRFRTDDGYILGNGTDNYGFSALPGGSGFPNGDFSSAGNIGFWWSATVDEAGNACSRVMTYNGEKVSKSGNPKTLKFSVRCVRD